MRLLIVDDHDVVQWGFRLMLSRVAWLDACIAAYTRAEALALAKRHRPHVALVDVVVGADSGPEICEQLRLLQKDMNVLLMSGAETISAECARACGALGFVPKERPAASIARALLMAARGQPMFDPADDRPSARSVQLTPRQRELLKHIATGATNREIAGSVQSRRTSIVRDSGSRPRNTA